MLRIYQSNASRDAKGYFDNELSKGDYYTEYQQVAGRWGGKSAGMLGLVGDVDKDGFHALCDNLHPVTKKRLGVRNKANRRVGYDISFHVPKSVSLVFEQSRDEAIITAFRKAVSETMSDMESEVRTRTSVGLKKLYPVTGNMVWAEFVHLTSRPVGGGVPDPHLHAHCFTFNTTYDSKERRWKAGEFSRIYHDAPYYQAAFQARLAKGLKDLGYGINRTEHAFEIAGVPESLIRKFSKRTSEIEKRAEELGITDPDEKGKLGARSRKHKNLEYTKEELQTEWDKQFTADESAAIRSVVANRGKDVSGKEVTAKAAMDHALSHGFERASVMDHKKLLAEALHYGMGDLDVSEVIAEGKRAEILTREIEGNLLSTTKEVLAEEKAMTNFARSTLNTRLPLVKDKEQILDTELNEEQVAGIKNIWSSYNQVMGIIGGAGVGKTRLMTEAIRGIENNGHKVFTFAPSASASRDTLQAEGFEAADTVARLFIDEVLQQQLQNQIIWIDEAGLLGVRDMNKIFSIAKKFNARVILSGDSKQHAPVARGDALRILEKQAGIKFPEIRKIQRQKSETYRDAVYALSQGNIDKAFDKLESINAIVEYKNDEERNAGLAREYAASVLTGEKVLIISPTHAEGEAVTKAVRDHLRQLDKLGSQEKTFVTLENLQLTEAEKKDSRNYEKGTVIEFHQNGFDMPVIGNIFDEHKNEDDTSDNNGDNDSDYYFRSGRNGIELRTRNGGNENTIASFSRTLKGYRHSSKGRAQISKGDSLYVLGKNGNGQIRVANKYGQILNLSLIQAARYQLYRPKLLSIAKNEKLLLTKNSRAQNNQKVNNGDLVRVKSFTKTGNIELSNGKTLSKTHGHLKYGYCTTSYASQGKTVDKILLAQSSKSKRASSKEQFYVSISRGKNIVKIFTDNKEALKNMVKSSSTRISAQELIKTPVLFAGQKLVDKLSTAIPAVRERIAERAVVIARLAITARAYTSTAATYTVDKAKIVGRVAGSTAINTTAKVADKAKTWAEKVGARSPKVILPENFKPQTPPGRPNGTRTI